MASYGIRTQAEEVTIWCVLTYIYLQKLAPGGLILESPLTVSLSSPFQSACLTVLVTVDYIHCLVHCEGSLLDGRHHPSRVECLLDCRGHYRWHDVLASCAWKIEVWIDCGGNVALFAWKIGVCLDCVGNFASCVWKIEVWLVCGGNVSSRGQDLLKRWRCGSMVVERLHQCWEELRKIVEGQGGAVQITTWSVVMVVERLWSAMIRCDGCDPFWKGCGPLWWSLEGSSVVMVAICCGSCDPS